MNFLKGLIGLNKNKPTSADFTKYTGEGRLFILGKTKECIFIASRVQFIQSKANPYDYSVHVQNLSDESAYDTNEYFFPISARSNLRSHFEKDEDEETMVFEWELDNGTVVCFEFDNQINDLGQADQFKEIFCKLIYEVISQEPIPDDIDVNEYMCLCRDIKVFEEEKQAKDLQDLTADIDKMKLSSQSQQSQKSQQSRQSLPVQPSQSQQSQQSQQSPTSRQSQPLPQIQNTVAQPEKAVTQPDKKVSKEPEEHKADEGKEIVLKLDKDAKLLYRIAADLVQINPLGNMTIISADVQVAVTDFGNFDHRYEVFDPNGDRVYSRPLTSELNYYVDHEESVFKWVETVNEELIIYACRLKAPASAVKEFKFLLARCIVEHNNKENMEDLFKKDEIDYARRMIAEDVEDDDEEFYRSRAVEYHEDLEIEDSFVRSNSKEGNQQNKNTGHAQAKVLDRTFVSKGSTISVYQTDENETALDFICDLPIVKSLSGHEITPKKMLLHEQDSKVLLLNNYDDRKVFYMDLERGKVIEELQADGINTMIDINPMGKHSELSANPCFLSMNARNIFKIDPRIHGTNKIASQKIYTKSPNFACITSTENEHFATGSTNGEVRLFKEVGQNAKTLFPGLGDPVISLDTTKDGKWLLATTKTYLILLPTFSETKNGYTHPLGKEKALPRRLQISPEDVLKHGMKDIVFTPAKFNDSETSKERFIVTSTNEFIVTWSLGHILKGMTFKYEIKKIDGRVVLDEFRYNRDDSVLVTMPNQVRIQKTRISSLKK